MRKLKLIMVLDIIVITVLSFLVGCILGTMTEGDRGTTIEVIAEPIPVCEEVVESETIEVSDVLSEEDKEIIARLVYAEARGECEEGKIAVYEVVMNRVNHKDYPDTVYGVVSQDNQFCGYNNHNYISDGYKEILPLLNEWVKTEDRYSDDMIFFKRVSEIKEWKGLSCTYYTTVQNHDFYLIKE